MHYIQKHILDTLRTVPSMRYAQLNTEEIESGHFRYHLSELVKGGYVNQLDRGVYALSSRGESFVDKLSSKTIKPSPMPKVITYTLLKDANTVLLHKKSKQPYMGLLNMIGGKLHEGELAADAAVREVKEKTGVIIQLPTLAGIFEILINADAGLFTHVIAYVFISKVDMADFKGPDIVAIPKNTLVKVDSLAPDFLPIYQKINNKQTIQADSLNLIMNRSVRTQK